MSLNQVTKEEFNMYLEVKALGNQLGLIVNTKCYDNKYSYIECLQLEKQKFLMIKRVLAK